MCRLNQGILRTQLLHHANLILSPIIKVLQCLCLSLWWRHAKNSRLHLIRYSFNTHSSDRRINEKPLTSVELQSVRDKLITRARKRHDPPPIRAKIAIPQSWLLGHGIEQRERYLSRASSQAPRASSLKRSPRVSSTP